MLTLGPATGAPRGHDRPGRGSPTRERISAEDRGLRGPALASCATRKPSGCRRLERVATDLHAHKEEDDRRHDAIADRFRSIERKVS